MKDWIFDRLKENSTWRGLILLAGVIGWHYTSDQQAAFVQAAMAVVALINICRKQPSVPGGKFNPNAEIRRGIPLEKP